MLGNSALLISFDITACIDDNIVSHPVISQSCEFVSTLRQ